ncbi:hypothetical protein RB598_006205 [Gaeumannomyces tritici]
MPTRLIDVRMSVFSSETSTPPYAILSHTWVEGQEADFQEMTRVMDSDQMHTCCINKSDLTELSESINSMFKWYKGAQACYAYLADLEADADVDTRLRGCHWFTRGWCLQELVAPRSLIFLDQTWATVGTRRVFKSLVVTITTIPVHVLHSAKDISEVLAGTPIATRMSWAANGATARVKDLAYCLLGIFDVNMPLLYGESSKAFLRLQQEIIKQSNDLSIFFSWDNPGERAKSRNCRGNHGGQSPYRSLLARSPADFWPIIHCECAKVRGATLRGLGAQQSSFTMENAGLFIRDAIMEVLKLESGGRCYALKIIETQHPGQCKPLHNPDMYLFLEKVDPGRFARLSYGFLGRYGAYEPRAPSGYLGSSETPVEDATEATHPRSCGPLSSPLNSLEAAFCLLI